MRIRRMTSKAPRAGYLRRNDPAGWRSESAHVLVTPTATRLFLLALFANVFDLVLSWLAILHYGLAAEANPIPVVAWGWSHGLIGGMAVKAALLAIVVACAAIAPRHTRVLLGLVGFAGIAGAVSALIVL